MIGRLVVVGVLAASCVLAAQDTGLHPADILKPLSDSWPTYSGDYTGRRYSALKQITQTNVQRLTLAWTTRLTAGPAGPVVPSPFGPRQPEVIVGGVGNNEFVGATIVKQSACWEPLAGSWSGSSSAHSASRPRRCQCASRRVGRSCSDSSASSCRTHRRRARDAPLSAMSSVSTHSSCFAAGRSPYSCSARSWCLDSVPLTSHSRCNE